MKTKPILLLLILMSAFNIFSFSQKTFKINITGYNEVNTENFTLTEDGGCIVAGSDPTAGGFPGLFLTSVDSKGNIRWSKTYDTNEERNILAGLIGTKDNGFVILTYITSSEATILYKCDSLGNIQWNKKIISYRYKNLYACLITQTTDGGYYVASSTFSDDDESKLVLIRLNDAGKLLWSKAYSLSYYEFFHLTAIGETHDGGAVLAIGEIRCEWHCIHNYLYSFDKNGNLKWGKYITIPGESDPQVQLIVSDSSSSIHFLCTLGGFEVFPYSYCYIRFDPDMLKPKAFIIPWNLFSLQYFFRKHSIDVIKGQKFPQTDLYEHPFYAVKKNWGLIRADDIYTPSYKRNMSIYQYDKTGRLCPNYDSPYVNRNFETKEISLYSRSLTQVFDSLILSDIDITVTPIENITHVCIGNSDAVSTASASDDAIKLNSSFDIKAFPNPVTNYINLQITCAENLYLEIQILQTDGKVVKNVQMPVSPGLNTKQVNIQSLSKGIYFMVVKGKGIQKRLKIVKQ